MYSKKSIKGKLSNGWIHTMFEDRNKNIWIGTSLGITKYDSSLNEFIVIKDSTYNIHDQFIISLIEDDDNNIWIGTNNGIYEYRTREKKIYRHFIQDGQMNSIKSLVFDQLGCLWVSTNKGLCRYNLNQKRDDCFYKEDGIQSNEFSRNAIFKDSINQKIILGGMGGITILNPLNFIDKSIDLDVYLTNFYVNNKPIDTESLSGKNKIIKEPILEAKEFNLDYSDNSFCIEFSCFKYAGHGQIYYKYILEGIDNEWNILSASDNKKIEYHKIPPGNYLLKMTAASGLSRSTEKIIKINILPPWYKSNMALLIYTIFTIIILCFIYSYITLRYKRSKEILVANHLQEIKEAKIQYFTNISHDIRTPISLIISPLENLIKKTNDKVFYVMWRNAQQILSLADQMIDMQKIDKGALKLLFSHTDIIMYLEDIIFSFTDQAQIRNIKLHFEKPDDFIFGWIDINQFDKIIYNLIANAFNFTPDGETIIIKIDKLQTGENEEIIRICIEDNGPGINEDNLKKVFNLFYQDKISTNNNRSSGIGLYLSKLFVDLHHGSIWVENKEKGGCCFFIEIPSGRNHISDYEIVNKKYESFNLQQYSDTTENNNETSQNNEKKKDKKSILIVDDQLEMRQYIKDILIENYYIIESEDGDKAFKIIQDIHPDLIISDVMMPGLNGIELCREIKQNNQLFDIPVILLTAKNSAEDQVMGYEFGADAYLSKPFNIDVLKSIVRNQLHQAEKNRIYLTNIMYEKEYLHKPQLSNYDDELIKKILNLIDANLSDSSFDIQKLCKEIGISRVHLYRKMKEITNQTPHEFVRNIRLKIAGELLKENKQGISYIAYAVGFSNISHFSKSFKAHYGISPKAYSEKNKQDNLIEIE